MITEAGLVLFFSNDIICDIEHVIKSFPAKILQGDHPSTLIVSSCATQITENSTFKGANSKFQQTEEDQ